MTTLHSYIYVIYSTNQKELRRLLQCLTLYIPIPPHDTAIYLFENCIYICACHDTVCSGQRAKEESIQNSIKDIQTKLIVDFPSLLVEFYFHHWHLRGYDKKGIFLGKDCFLHKMAISNFKHFHDPGKHVDLSDFFGKGKPNTVDIESVSSYIQTNGKVYVKGSIWPLITESFQECLIDDD
jgi:hypothetical protein